MLVRNAIQQRRLQEENQNLRTELGHRYQIIGQSVPMKALRQQIAVTAPTNGRVLIYGESGTGKSWWRVHCTRQACAAKACSWK